MCLSVCLSVYNELIDTPFNKICEGITSKWSNPTLLSRDRWVLTTHWLAAFQPQPNEHLYFILCASTHSNTQPDLASQDHRHWPWYRCKSSGYCLHVHICPQSKIIRINIISEKI